MVDHVLPDAGPAGLYDVAQLRDVERNAQAVLAPHTLMRRAGLAAADHAQMLAIPAAAQSATAQSTAQSATRSASGRGVDAAGAPQPSVLIVAGPGNNGGDAFECGFHLGRRGWRVTLWIPVLAPDPGPDYAQALERVRSGSATIIEPTAAADGASLVSQTWSLVIDGLFGIGLTRALGGHLQTVVETMNAIDAPLLALDVPSGLNADTGTILPGADQSRVCVRATHTLTFIADKPGLHTGDGRDHAGRVSVAALDIDPALLPAPRAVLNRPALFAHAAQPRRHASHKGSFGDVQIIGGAAGMVGAALLAAHAALKAGSGRVLIGFPDPAHAPQYDPLHPELMCRSAATLDLKNATLVVGPGLGSSQEAGTLILNACGSDAPLVLDADALNLVAATPALASALRARASRHLQTIMTPHPLEAARLLGSNTETVQSDRLHAAATLAERFSATVILKGSGSVIADGTLLVINPTGNPALATGGTGDVLAGLCGALLAQGWPAREAALGAVWMHGMAADQLVEDGIGPTGVTATEIIDAARRVLNDLTRTHGSKRRQGRTWAVH